MFRSCSFYSAGQLALWALLCGVLERERRGGVPYDNLIAEVVGGALSGARYIKQGWLTVIQVALSGTFLAHFVGADIASLVLQYSGVAISYGAVLFLTAYLGPTALERAQLFIKAFQVSKLWNSKK